MIRNNEGTKAYNVSVDGRRVYRAYIGKRMIFSSYVIPSLKNVWIRSDCSLADGEIKSNTEWEMK